jgi:hypothetical protein
MPVCKQPVRLGANDHPMCRECKGVMHLVRRVPHSTYGIEYERQTFQCRSCRNEIERNAERAGEITEKPAPTLWPHSYAILDRALKTIEEDDDWIDDFIKRLNCAIENLVRPK